jgi:multisubunit Na+/H+ antiporter MnhB subunit
MALMGMVSIGPVELFFPTTATVVLGQWVWVAVGMIYGLTVLWLMLNMRPQWVIYGASLPVVGPALLAAARKRDLASVWQNEFVDLPESGLRLQISIGSNAACRVVALSSSVSLRDWYQLRRDLQKELDQVRSSSRATGFLLLACAGLIFVLLTLNVVVNPQGVATAFQDWLNH